MKNAHQFAVQKLANSYSPYSHLQVAAALKLKGIPEFIGGINVENASYGATICAERAAILSARSQYGDKALFEYMVVVSTYKGDPISPCGMCLQVISEFVSGDFPIYLGNQTEIIHPHRLKSFLPLAFSKKVLQTSP